MYSSAPDTIDLLEIFARGIRPLPKPDIAEWCAKNVFLPASVTARPGPLRVHNIQRQILDAIQDPSVTRVSAMLSSQIGKTATLIAYLSYRMAADPANMMLVHPTQVSGHEFSGMVLEPVIRESPTLRKLVGKEQSARGGEARRLKMVPGGSLSIASAQVPAELASKAVQVVLLDELDRMPDDLGLEGDVLAVVERRSASFVNRKTVAISTPTVAGSSKIERLFNAADARVFSVECPDCRAWQEPKIENLTYTPGVYDDAVLACGHCGSLWDEPTRQRLLETGRFIATKEPSTPGQVSFTANELSSPFSTLSRVAAEHDKAQQGGSSAMRAFTNLVLGKPASLEERAVDVASLLGRREPLPLDALPNDVAGVLVTIDVQMNRLEALLIGFNRDRLWILAHAVVPGDVAGPHAFQGMAAFLRQTVRRQDGTIMRVCAAAIDAGAFSQRVLDYVGAMRRVGVPLIATKGASGWGRALLSTTGRKAHYWTVGVDQARSIAWQRLLIEKPDAPGFIHISDTISDAAVEQLTAERLVTFVSPRTNQSKMVWSKVSKDSPTETWDCLVYGLALLDGKAVTPAAIAAATTNPNSPPQKPETVVDLTRRLSQKINGANYG